MYDFAIIGLGPAGATVARLLDIKYRIIAIDRKSADDDSFRKPCGGLLATDAQKVLSKMNLTLPKDVLADPQIFAVKTMDLNHNLVRHYPRFYLNLDRQKFDRWLISLIPDHVEIADHSNCSDIKRNADGYEITFIQNQTVRKITAKHIIGADGSNSLSRRKLFPDKTIRQYLSVQQRFYKPNSSPSYTCIFDHGITHSYCWGISKDGYFILGGAFPKKLGKQNFEHLKEKISKQGLALGEPVKTEACLLSQPRKLRDFCVGADRAFLLGEAAGFISPTSFEGISYALSSASLLAKILNSGCRNPVFAYKVKTFPMRIKLLLKYVKYPFLYFSFLRRIVMKSGMKSLKGIKE